MSLHSLLTAATATLLGIVGLLVSAPTALAEDSGRIDGRVLAAPDGAAIAEARVELHRFDSATGNWPEASTIWTDADGRYRFAGLAAGRYRVCASSNAGLGGPNSAGLYLPRCWRKAATPETADEIVLEPDSPVNGVLIRLQARGLISGRVTDPNGDPVTSGNARAYWSTPGGWYPGPYSVFDEQGRYELRVDNRREYRVCFQVSDGGELANECWDGAPSLPTSTPLPGPAPNQTIDGIDAQLDFGGRISGLIHDYPVGTQGSVEILAYRRYAGEWSPVGWNSLEPYATSTPYEVGNLPSGTYRVCFNSQDFEFFPVFANECVGGTPTPDTATDIEVVNGETTPDADVELGAASRIRGTVSGTSEPVPVQLLTATGELIFERMTAADGTYGFSGLPNGSYRLAFNRVPGETRLAARFYKNKAEQVGVGKATAVELGEGDFLNGLSSALVTGGALTGRVVTPAGTGVSGCRVRAYTPDDALVSRWSTTNGNGRFDLGGLSTGPYRLLVAAKTCGLDQTDLHFDASAPSRLSNDPALADPLAVVIGSPTALPGRLVVTQVRNLQAPTITGTARAGEPLNADPGSWSPGDAGFSYRWSADGALLPGAAGPSYTPGAAQVGSRIRVRVLASKAGYTTAGRNSASTAPVSSGP